MVALIGGHSAIPISSIEKRMEGIEFYPMNMTSQDLTSTLLDFEPDAIVHLAEQPSAPFSMRSVRHAIFTHNNNLSGTLNLLYAIKTCEEKLRKDIHLVKLGSMGEYGTPDTDIPEGFDSSGKPAPKYPGSWYHATKVHDSTNIKLACKLWDIWCTDIMQGIVYGVVPLSTRFDFDECFGTVINRFCAQGIIGHDLTVYGAGTQKRGFLPLSDSLECIRLIIVKSEYDENQLYRVINQFAEVYELKELAEIVQLSLNTPSNIKRYPNPRIEKEEHIYNPECKKLKAMGYKPSLDVHSNIKHLLGVLEKYKSRIRAKSYLLEPKTDWR
jgi:nucleoside-diphosphate-sugar epimerase